MKKLLADYFPNEKERNDFYIALVVIALFIFGLSYFIFPKQDTGLATVITEAELAERVADLDQQRLAFSKPMVTDIADYRPYYDHRQKNVVYDEDVQIEPLLETTLEVEELEMEDENISLGSDEENTTGIITDEEMVTETESLLLEEDTIERTAEEWAAAIEEEVPPSLNEDGSVVENAESRDAVTIDTRLEDSLAMVEEKERLAAEAAAKAKREREKRRAAERKKRAAATLSGCHVIVGAFKSTRNARSFREQVKAQNFSVAVGRVRGKMYVGIPVPCGNESTIKSTQERVNATFGIQSWVLRK